MTKPELIAKIEDWALAHNVPVSKGLHNLSEDKLILLWVRLQCCDVRQSEAV